MAHRDRKIIKKRGSRTCGYGGSKKHRGAGSRGGRGMAGSKKHKWSYVSKYMPGYFGRKGFKRPSKVVREVKTLNVGDLEKNLARLVDEKRITLKGKKYHLNLRDMGYGKLLGSGRISHPMVITVDSCSKLALEKIEDAGGSIETSE
jgi:large subunit ribosomal protein L15